MHWLIVFGLIVALIYLEFCSCFCNNHSFEIVERDDDYDCHKLKCTRCGHETHHDPYAGIGG